MRFRFCGDSDVPDYVLAEINSFSKITSIKMRSLCVTVLSELVSSVCETDKLSKFSSDSRLSADEVKSMVATLVFVFSSAAKFQVPDDVLGDELQQLGLPREHAVSLCKAYAAHADALRSALRARSLRIQALADVHWRLDFLLPPDAPAHAHHRSLLPVLHLRLRHLAGVTQFALTEQQLHLLLEQLYIVRQQMDNLELA